MLYVGIDACDAPLMRRYAADGTCPRLAALLAESAVAPTTAPYGTYVGSSWMTISTGCEPGRHGFWNWLEVDPSTYGPIHATPRSVPVPPFWLGVAAAGNRVAVLDVPHMAVVDGFDGVLLKEWGCHDRHDGTDSWPPAVLAELDATVGRHPVGCNSHPAGDIAFAPCDYTLRDGPYRSTDEERQLLQRLREGVEVKRRASLALMRREPWDLFMTVLGEAHCVGHQLWHVHDPSHPRHDPAVRRALGDPVRDIYARLDSVLGDLIDEAGPDTTVVVQMNHGMGPHFDGHHLLDELLRRIDDALAGTFTPGRLSQAGSQLLRRSSGRARSALQRAAAAGLRGKGRLGEPLPDAPMPPKPERRFFQIDGNTSVGAVRFNLLGREAEGLVHRGDEYERLRWDVAQALLDVIDVATGEPLVRRVVLAEEVLDRSPGDHLPDLFVEWNRDRLVERVWSPLTGTVTGTYWHWRTGDHHDGGMFVVRGPGVVPGERDVMSLVDTAPTVAAAVGVELPDVDGRVRSDLLGAAEVSTPRTPAAVAAPDAPPRDATSRDLAAAALDIATTNADRMDVLGVHLQQHLHELRHRVEVLERERSVWTTTAWLAHEPVRDDVLVSVITPTYARPDRLETAIRSVIAQRHQRWQMVVVDDGSCTARPVVERIGDPRVCVIDVPHGGACAARNAGLDHACGELVAFLDDDNVLDPGWLHAVVWAFADHPERSVLYGARLIEGEGPGGSPLLQFHPFDRDRLRDHNFTDMGVIAHRSGLAARFDESLVECGDWDYLLALTEDHEPFELPALAVHYRTGGPGRLTGARPSDADRVRAKWARRPGASA